MEVLRHPWERVHARVWTIETTSINAECARVSRVCPGSPRCHRFKDTGGSRTHLLYRYRIVRLLGCGW